MKSLQIILMFCTLSAAEAAWGESAIEPNNRLYNEQFIPITVGSIRNDERSFGQTDNQTTIRSKVIRYPESNDRELRERIRILELAVRQLQDEIYRLRIAGRINVIETGRRISYSCMLTTPFGGTFYGKGETMLEAKAKSLNACERGEKGFCRDEKVLCEKAQ